MFKFSRLVAIAGLVWLSAWAVPSESFGQETDQTLLLRPGWNAIHLEVQPADDRADAVFEGLPYSAAWTRQDRLSSVDFIANPAEEPWNRAGWLVHIPEGRPDRVLTNLHRVEANRAYLLLVTGDQPIEWTVRGRPTTRLEPWVPDTFNLRGFPVDPAAPPTFNDYFRSSAAHADPATGRLREVHRLDSTGRWVAVSGSDRMQSGEAYWVFTQGRSLFQGPLELNLAIGDGLDFGAALADLKMGIRSRRPGENTVTIRRIGSAGDGVLRYETFDGSAGSYSWTPFSESESLALPLPAGSERRLGIGVRRRAMSGPEFGAVLELNDGAGTRRLVAVSARKRPLESGNEVRQAEPADVSDYAGLWIGNARIDAVSEAIHVEGEGLSPGPTPTRSPFDLRLLIHVDSEGRARLLKEVILMWEDGDLEPDGAGGETMGRPGRYVLLTDPSLIPMFEGAALRDGVSVGRRISAPGFDFDGGDARALDFDGAFEVGSSIAAVIDLPADFPTNPFRHKFHPDHDNLDERYEGPNPESLEIRREVALAFGDSDPTGYASPDYGFSVVGGVYTETLSGLHKQPITVRGRFRLARASLIGELNPEPR